MVESTRRFAQFEWNQAKTIFGDFRSSTTQSLMGQENFPHGGGEHDKCREGHGDPPTPPPLVQVPPLRPNLGPLVIGPLSQS